MNMQNALSSAVNAARIGALFGAAAVIAIAATAPATAGSKVRGEYATSKSPVFKVGTYSKELSALCRQGRFLQRGDLKLSIGYIGQKGYGITGIANKDYNLYDPEGVAKDDKSYHFFNQGYSNCRVYVATIPPNLRK